MNDVFGLYIILTDPVCGYETCAEAAVREGIHLLQLRMKNQPTKEILQTAHEIRGITRGSETLFIVNDDVHIAAEADADGVHLGQDDMSIGEARSFWSEQDKVFGLSTHNMAQAVQAAGTDPDYIGVGPVFKTPTKAVPDPVVGVEEMGKIISAVRQPAVAIGGISIANLPDILAAGAVNFAAVRPLMQSLHPRSVIREFMDIWMDYREKNC